MTSAPLRTGSTAPRKLKRSGSSGGTLSPLTSSLASRRTSSLSSPRRRAQAPTRVRRWRRDRRQPPPLLGDGDESSYRRVRGREVAFERFQVMGRLRLLEWRQPQLVGLSEQSCAVGRVAQLPRETSGSVEPQAAAPEIGRQPSASFQHCRGDCVRAAKPRALGSRFEPHCHLFVRTYSGTGGVPGSTVGIIAESLGKSSMRSPPLLRGCGLLHG